jgi:hypothetical protein
MAAKVRMVRSFIISFSEDLFFKSRAVIIMGEFKERAELGD